MNGWCARLAHLNLCITSQSSIKVKYNKERENARLGAMKRAFIVDSRNKNHSIRSIRFVIKEFVQCKHPSLQRTFGPKNFRIGEKRLEC
jgi:hypothetical protein